MKVTVLTHTPEPEKTVAAAARLCYSDISALEIFHKLSEEKAGAFIEKLADMGHMSPLEHVSFTFGIDGVSRTLLAQITRHRIASFSVQSLRYNNPFDGEIPPEDNSREEHYYELGLKMGKPGEFGEGSLPAYLRGVYDATGDLLQDEGLSLALDHISLIPNMLPFDTIQMGERVVVPSGSVFDFASYIYGDLDFAVSPYSKRKLVELCEASNEFRISFTRAARDYVGHRYYSTLPEKVAKNPDAVLIFIDGLNQCKRHYCELVAMGVDQEDARNILPMSTQTRIVMTMNARSLYNFFNLRCCERAQSEIRHLAYLMLGKVKKIAPSLFKTAGAPCESTGICPEGSMSCGKYPTQ